MSLPKGWTNKQIGEIASVVRGSSPRPAGDPRYFNGNHLSWITVGDVTNGDSMRLNSTKSRLTELGAKHTRIIQPGTVLLSNSGATLGVPKILGIIAGANDGIAAFLDLKDSVSPEYLYFFLQSKTNDFRERIAPGVGQPNLNTELIGGYLIPLPPLPEQIEIARILGVWDAAIGDTTQLIAAKTQHKRGLMQQLLFGERRFAEFEGQAWQTRKLGDVLEEVNRFVDWDDEAQYNLLSIRRRSGGFFFRQSLMGHEILTKVMKVTRTGDFVIAPIQPLHGATSLTPAHFDGYHVSGSYTTFIPRPEIPLHAPFLNYLSQSPSFYQLVLRSAYGVSIEKMTFDVPWFLEESVKLPPTLAEQRRIADVLDAATAEIQLLQKQLDALKTQKRGLMQLLLSGEKSVAVANAGNLDDVTRSNTEGER